MAQCSSRTSSETAQKESGALVVGVKHPQSQISNNTMTHDTREELKTEWLEAWEYHEDRPEYQAEWWLTRFDHQLQKAREEEREYVIKTIDLYNQKPSKGLDWLKWFLTQEAPPSAMQTNQSELDQDKK